MFGDKGFGPSLRFFGFRALGAWGLRFRGLGFVV